MAFDPKELEGLAATLLEKGLPILGGLIGGPVGAVAGNVVSGVVGQIATTLGLPSDATPAVVSAAVQTDPQAADKLSEFEAHASSALDFAKLQADENAKEAESASLFVSGWRPAFGWICVFAAVYQVAASASSFPLIPADAFNPIWAAFGGMLGLRTIERWKGVAQTTLTIFKPKAAKKPA